MKSRFSDIGKKLSHKTVSLRISKETKLLNRDNTRILNREIHADSQCFRCCIICFFQIFFVSLVWLIMFQMQVFLFVYIIFRAIFQLIGWVIQGFLYVLWMLFGGIAYLVNYLMERKT
ncbi:hypothetical protein HMPREF0973_00529 [Prevotella veroralis F0319]|uniref:Uncharacterized protein n=1 Tax=Prevotella veroralis F0319 TaxID=649761 RepID=C9MLQ3_9BACT|nr:hypothetical protein HMPREF0973_00529 [Prevotella veroralis F0319]